MKIILKDIPEDDWILGIRAIKRLATGTSKDAVISYEGGKSFYVRRNKASITVCPCGANG